MTSRTLRGMFWVFLGTVVQVILQLVVLGVLARLIAKPDFGLVNAALIAIGFITLAAQWIGPAPGQSGRAAAFQPDGYVLKSVPPINNN